MGTAWPLGGQWNGEYLVADLTVFSGRNLRADVGAAEFPRFRPQIVKVVRTGKLGTCFPLKKTYDRVNCTLEGIEETAPISDQSVEMSVREKSPDEIDALSRLVNESDNDLADDEREKVVFESIGDDPIADMTADREEVSIYPDTYQILTDHKYDAIGKRYGVDQFGNRMYKSSRPAWVDIDDWNIANKEGKNIFRATSGLPPLAASKLIDPDDEWNSIDDIVNKYESEIDSLSRGHTLASAATQPRKRKYKSSRVPLMPCMPVSFGKEDHRPKSIVEKPFFGIPACVARPVDKKEMLANPKAIDAMIQEWARLRDKHVWDEEVVMTWNELRKLRN